MRSISRRGWPTGLGASLLRLVVQRAGGDARPGPSVDGRRLACRERQPHRREGSLHEGVARHRSDSARVTCSLGTPIVRPVVPPQCASAGGIIDAQSVKAADPRRSGNTRQRRREARQRPQRPHRGRHPRAVAAGPGHHGQGPDGTAAHRVLRAGAVREGLGADRNRRRSRHLARVTSLPA
jgi:hypothetical protein